ARVFVRGDRFAVDADRGRPAADAGRDYEEPGDGAVGERRAFLAVRIDRGVGERLVRDFDFQLHRVVVAEDDEHLRVEFVGVGVARGDRVADRHAAAGPGPRRGASGPRGRPADRRLVQLFFAVELDPVLALHFDHPAGVRAGAFELARGAVVEEPVPVGG